MSKGTFITRILCIAALLNLAAGYSLWLYLNRHGQAGKMRNAMGRFFKVMQLVRRNYYDDSKTSPDKLANAALDGLTDSLDHWTQYLRPEGLRSVEDNSAGTYGGIGITYTWRNSHLIVTGFFEDSPALKAGMKLMDEIVAIDGAGITQKDMEGELVRIRGKIGTKLSLTVLRNGEELTFDMERASIKIPVVSDRSILEGGISYVRLLQFSDTTLAPLQEALEFFKEKKVRGLILDLRDNPGGKVSSAIDVCSLFLPGDHTVVTMKGRNGVEDYTYKTKAELHSFPDEIPMVILINGNSASSAEITAGCLKDHGRAVLVGTKSYGKGVAQTVFPLEDGTAVQITTTRFFTPDPNRGSIHGNGIQPDVEIDIPLDENNEKEASQAIEKKLDPSQDPQVIKALETLKEKFANSKEK